MFRFGRIHHKPSARQAEPRLLVVDDDVELLQIVRISAAMTAREMQVDVAPTAADALEFLRDERYSVVLLDQCLDGANRGADLVPTAQRRQPDAVIAMMSSLGVDALVSLTTPFGTLPVIPKPFSAFEIRNFLHEALGRPGLRRGNVAPLDSHAA